MGQLNFFDNFPAPAAFSVSWAASHGTLSFIPINIYESISLLTLNLRRSQHSGTISFSVGLYSLTDSSLSIVNSLSATQRFSTTSGGWLSLTNTSATQNITPGTWWIGLVIGTSGNSGIAFVGQNFIGAANAFPGAFIGGRMTVSTTALPDTYATSDLDITGSDAMNVVEILLTA